MMQEEIYGTRDRTYSAWHRRLSTRRFVGIDRAQLLAMIDLDASLYVEYDDGTKEPIALIETARDVGQRFKSATVTTKLAKLSGLPCYCVLYSCSDAPNPADPAWPDISEFRVKRLWPKPEHTWRTVKPGEWAGALLKIRAWASARVDVIVANDDVY
jgi:hypothetical protein